MNTRVAAKFQQLQNDFTQLISLLDKENSQILETSPAPYKWSVTQVMYHLNKAESLSALYVSKKRLGAAFLKRTGVWAQLKIFIAWIGFNLPVRYPAAKVLGDMPPEVDYNEIKTEWLKTRQTLFNLLESLSDDEIKKPLFKQPFFGRWNIFQMLSFMQIHFNRHRKQILRTIEVVNTQSE